jgi:hypothetical protein
MNEQDIMGMISNALSKYGAGDIHESNFQSFYQELSNRIIAYEIQTSWNWIYISLVFVVLGLIAIGVAVAKRKDWDEYSWAVGIVGAVFVLAFGIVIGVQLDDITTCKTFPEKIVIEHVKIALKQLLNVVN